MISSNIGGLNGWAFTDVLYKNKGEEKQKETVNEQIAIEQIIFQKPPCPNGTLITLVSWKQGYANSCTIFFFWRLWRHLVDFGCNLGPSWIPRWVPQSKFWASSWKNDEKRVSKNETRKTFIVDWKLAPKCEVIRGTSECFAENVLQNSNVRGVMKYWGHWCLNGHPKRPKS